MKENKDMNDADVEEQVEEQLIDVESKAEKKKKDKVLKIKESEYAKIVEEGKEYKDKYLRLFAEFDNARKRMDREKQDFVKYANEELIVEILTILDGLELSIKSAKAKDSEDGEAFLKGIEMVVTQMHAFLNKYGVKPIKALGTIFDPHNHEVLLQEETSEHDDGLVLEELQKGYLLGEKVVRTAKVKIAKQKN